MGKQPHPTWVYNDGGREAAGFKGSAGDCVTRAIAIASGLPYRDVYDTIAALNADTHSRRRSSRYTRTRSGRERSTSARSGSYRKAYQPYLEELGFRWVPTMRVGQGTTVHLRADELPTGTILAKVTHHLTTVIDGVINDTHDPSRDGTRAVYGYFTRDSA